MTSAKAELIKNFQDVINKKRRLSYKIQFTGPTGSDAVEAALKLARKYTGRKNVIYFSNSFHGMTMGSLSIAPKKIELEFLLDIVWNFHFIAKILTTILPSNLISKPRTNPSIQQQLLWKLFKPKVVSMLPALIG